MFPKDIQNQDCANAKENQKISTHKFLRKSCLLLIKAIEQSLKDKTTMMSQKTIVSHIYEEQFAPKITILL